MSYFGLTGQALSVLQIALIVCPAFILFGYNQAGLGGLLTTQDWTKTFPEIDTVHTTGSEKKQKSTLQGFVVATFTIGALCGALSCSWTGDKFGRRNVIFAAGICTLIGEALECSAHSLAQLIVGRIIVGLGIGQLSSIVPVWQSETSGAKNRGRHVVLDGLFICVGYVLESWINLGFWEFKSGPITWRPSIAIDKLLYRFGLCMMVQFYQQMSGSNLISVYATILFQENLGMGTEMARVLTAGALTWKFLSSFLGFVCIDRFGRRAVFIISGVGMSSCMVALAISTSFPKENKAAQIAAGCFIYLYNTFVPIGFLGANFLYATEIAPIKLRMAMSSLSTANHWLWNFVVVMVTPVAIRSIGYQYYIVYAVIAACIPVSVYFLFPETMGRNLEEIDMMFRESPSVLGTVRFARNRPIAMPQEFDHEKPGDETDYVETREEVRL
ncbi:sugar transporter STL1 [Verticillium dahliae VdLs.17]|uniref:Sugar transporter STL1 n=1 Tax=Verticillium dahliae (strain VdLs.17 / ATCC MYA-4575 / FGSC 10137) TaxID=498257 RepID=G2XHE8_VERDV|nr:sugar transporter STL1 [Verticillium dahliae VdLs.17]EGY19242.1 sugar transporter STL1 [Verticillium dahliae VdLs.17]